MSNSMTPSMKWFEDIYIRSKLPPIEKKLVRAKHIKTVAMYVTINPRPDVPFNKFKKKCIKLLSSKTYDWILLVFEQRGENLESLGKGFHCHLLFKLKEYSLSPYDHKRAFKRKFRTMLDVENPHLLNVQPIPAHLIQKKKDYLILPKIDEKKHKKQKMDAIWRKKKNLQPIYRECPELTMENVIMDAKSVKSKEHGEESEHGRKPP